MGNCQAEFTNVPNLEDQWQNKQRVDNSMIDRTHIQLQVANLQEIKIGAIRQEYLQKQIDNQRLYDTKPLNANNIINVNFDKPQQFIIKPAQTLQPLDLNFYYQLALPEYSYHQIPTQSAYQYKELQINQHTDRYGVKYVGEWKRGQLHGNGVLTSNTRKYIGQFRQGLKHFHGREIEKYEVYEGQYKNGRRYGEGIRYTPDKIEKGIFEDILVNGVLRFKNESYFQGTLVNGVYQGKKCTYFDSESKIRYEGEFKKGKMTGWGILIYPNQRRYQGQLLDGLKHGQGTFFWDQYTFYKGSYKNDQKHGAGVLKVHDKIFEGTFKNGLLDGQVNVTEGYYKSKKHFSYGKQIDDSERSIDEGGLPPHWR